MFGLFMILIAGIACGMLSKILRQIQSDRIKRQRLIELKRHNREGK